MTTTTAKLGHGDSFPFYPNHDGDQMRCAVCNRKLGNNPFIVEVIDGGNIHDPSNGQANIYDSGYMGAWFVGSECSKKFFPSILVKKAN